MSEAHDHSTLKWVRGEIDVLIDQARHSLEAFLEQPANSALLNLCLERLNQVRGTLQMMQIYGASMLAEEMELVAQAMQQGQVPRREEAAEALMMGLAQLPGYLEKLETGTRDIPLLVLPMLNELRAAREAALLSEVALFAPELDQRLALAEGEAGVPNPELSALAHGLRLSYHKGLLGWYRGREVNGGLKRVGEVLKELEQQAGSEPVRRLLRAGRAVTEGLREGSIKTGVATKELYGELDRVIKRIIDQGETAVVEAPPDELLKNFLYYISSATSDNAIIREVKQAYGLDDTLLSQVDLERERVGLRAPGQELMLSVKRAINADLTAIKDGLDLFIRGQSSDMDRLAALAGPMRKIADTLGMIGQGGLRERLKRQAERIDELAETGETPDEQTLMGMAGDILFIETTLENMAKGRFRNLRPSQSDSGMSELPEGEFEKLIDSVIHEAEVDMARNREAIVSFIESPGRTDLLRDVPQRFRSVSGAFRIMGLNQAAELLQGLSRYVTSSLLGGHAMPSAEQIDTFADAVTSIEYFMSSVTEGRGVHNEVLDIAGQSLKQLGVNLDPVALVPEPEDETPLFETESREPEGLVEEEIGPEPVVLEQPVGESEPKLELEPEPGGQEEIDPEILEIFIEEAGEELEVIQEYVPRWCANPEDSDALATFRRSFHTLKGSGRLVGADDIGEFAWSIENLLNRIIDGTVEVTPELFSLLRESVSMLPGLIGSQVSGDTAAAEVQPLMERAFSMAESAAPTGTGQAVETLEPEGAADETAVSAVVVPFPGADVRPATEQPEIPAMEEAPPPIRVDPVLLEIFLSESRGHIENLRQFVSNCRADPQGCDLGRGDIPRSLHTLHGSADMAGVEPIAAVSTLLETCINELEVEGAPADTQVLDLIESSITCFESVLSTINQPGAVLPDWQGLLQEIGRYLEQVKEGIAREQAPVPEAEFEPETEQLSAQEPEPEPVVEQISRPEPPADEVVPVTRAVEYEQLDGDPELVEIFVEESRELLDSVGSSLEQWRNDPTATEPLNELQRTLHTLKGGARLSGAMPVGDLSHAFESLLSGVEAGEIEADAGVVGLSQLVADRLEEQLEDIALGPQVRRSDDLIRRLEQVAGRAESPQPVSDAGPEIHGKKEERVDAGGQPAERPPASESVASPREPRAEPALSTSTEGVPAAKPVSRTAREQIRVSSGLLDRLVNNAGEVSIYRARLEQQTSAMGFNLSELEQTVDRLRTQLRQLDIETEAQILFRYEKEKEEGRVLEETFDPLEMDRFSTMQHLSRSLMETVNDLSSINGFLDELQEENATLLQQQARVTTDLQDSLLRTRMVPFSQLVPRLQRIVRQTAGTLGKQAQLDVYGAEGELDRGILDRMIGPLEHILRNAVSHGIETPQSRHDAGKEESGQITIRQTREGNDVVLTISDDGKGINIDLIRQRAIEKGLLDPKARVPDSDVLQFVLEHGFSTQQEVTQISGRGVGLDVVAKEVKLLGGSLDISSEQGAGSRFLIRLPLTLAISDALLVELRDEIYAIPHTSIEGVVRLPLDELMEFYQADDPCYRYADHDYRVRYLGELLNLGQSNFSDQRKWYPLLLVRAGEHRVALQVDGLLGNRQIVVKSVGPQISSIRWISGGTILGDGRVALIVDVTALVRLDAARAVPTAVEMPVPTGLGVGRMVMVVDDSITVRKVTERVLERHGMRVVTAKDGVDAVTLLQEYRPDLMLLDIEMPRMDGYELARHMRNTEELKEIPIIMITSRTGDKHRKLALELGVKRYLGKPYQEADLLDNIHSVLAGVEL
jgi:chemosensory pili system protein ChpA (sensor histidine kinase/response regulator)